MIVLTRIAQGSRQHILLSPILPDNHSHPHHHYFMYFFLETILLFFWRLLSQIIQGFPLKLTYFTWSLNLRREQLVKWVQMAPFLGKKFPWSISTKISALRFNYCKKSILILDEVRKLFPTFILNPIENSVQLFSSKSEENLLVQNILKWQWRPLLSYYRANM